MDLKVERFDPDMPRLPANVPARLEALERRIEVARGLIRAARQVANVSKRVAVDRVWRAQPARPMSYAPPISSTVLLCSQVTWLSASACRRTRSADASSGSFSFASRTRSCQSGDPGHAFGPRENGTHRPIQGCRFVQYIAPGSAYGSHTESVDGRAWCTAVCRCDESCRCVARCSAAMPA